MWKFDTRLHTASNSNIKGGGGGVVFLIFLSLRALKEKHALQKAKISAKYMPPKSISYSSTVDTILCNHYLKYNGLPLDIFEPLELKGL